MFRLTGTTIKLDLVKQVLLVKYVNQIQLDVHVRLHVLLTFAVALVSLTAVLVLLEIGWVKFMVMSR